MNENLREEQTWLITGALMILAAVAVAVMLWYTRSIMVPFVLAIFIAVGVSPIVDFLVVRWRFPKGLAIAAAVLVVVAILAVFGLLLIMGVERMVEDAGQYSDSFSGLAEKAFHKLEQWHIDVDPNALAKQIEDRMQNVVLATVGTATGLISSAGWTIIFVLFLLAGRDSHKVSTGFYAETEALIRRYIGTKFFMSLTTGILVWVFLALFGLRMAMLFGILAFMLNFIPSIGSIIATLLPIPVALVQFGDDPLKIVAVIALPGATQMILGNVVEPKVMERGLELHPVVTILALMVWGLIWGPVGMILAVPITASIRILLMRYASTRALGGLLAGQLPGTARPSPPQTARNADSPE